MKHAGYLLVTEGIPRFGGDVLREFDTFTCAHCNFVVIVKPKQGLQAVQNYCHGCMKMVCPECYGKRKCDPMEEKLLREAASYEARRSYGLEG